MLLDHYRFYSIGNIYIYVESQIPFEKWNLDKKLNRFEIILPTALEYKNRNALFIKHCFILPSLKDIINGKKIYDRPPWIIYDNGHSYIYIFRKRQETQPSKVVVINRMFDTITVFHDTGRILKEQKASSLTLLPTDQLILAPFLSLRRGCIMHAAGAVISKAGFLFIGSSGAGKSTISELIRDRGKVLCDERIIVRQEGKAFAIYGTWSHGTFKEVNPDSARLHTIFFIKKAGKNRVIKIHKKTEKLKKLISHIIQPYVTKQWWFNTLNLLEDIVNRVEIADLFFCDNKNIGNYLKEYAESN